MLLLRCAVLLLILLGQCQDILAPEKQGADTVETAHTNLETHAKDEEEVVQAEQALLPVISIHEPPQDAWTPEAVVFVGFTVEDMPPDAKYAAVVYMNNRRPVPIELNGNQGRGAIVDLFPGNVTLTVVLVDGDRMSVGVEASVVLWHGSEPPPQVEGEGEPEASDEEEEEDEEDEEDEEEGEEGEEGESDNGAREGVGAETGASPLGSDSAPPAFVPADSKVNIESSRAPEASLTESSHNSKATATESSIDSETESSSNFESSRDSEATVSEATATEASAKNSTGGDKDEVTKEPTVEEKISQALSSARFEREAGNATLARVTFRDAADTLGSAQARFEYAMMLVFGEGGDVQVEEALQHLHAAKAQVSDAGLMLGLLHAAAIPEMGGLMYFHAAVQYYEECANQDNPLCLHLLGLHAFFGNSMPADCHTAVRHMRKAAESAHSATKRAGTPPPDFRSLPNLPDMTPDTRKEREEQENYNAEVMRQTQAQVNVGYRLFHGTGQDKVQNRSAAAEMFRTAAEAGDGTAMANWGLLHLFGSEGVPLNHTEARIWFERGAELKNPFAYNNLGRIYSTGEGVEINVTKSLYYLDLAARGRHGDASVSLGTMYRLGFKETGRNYSMAWEYLGMTNSYDALIPIGEMYYAGEGCQPNCEGAFKMFKVKAESRAEANKWLFDGYTAYFRRQYRKALLHFVFAAQLGMELAMVSAAWMYQQGEGCADDHARYQKAMYWYKQASDLNNDDGHIGVADFLYYGYSQAANHEAAALFYSLAPNNPRALFSLAHMYANGEGVARNTTLALELYAQAAAAGNQHSWPANLAYVSLWTREFSRCVLSVSHALFSGLGDQSCSPFVGTMYLLCAAVAVAVAAVFALFVLVVDVPFLTRRDLSTQQRAARAATTRFQGSRQESAPPPNETAATPNGGGVMDSEGGKGVMDSEGGEAQPEGKGVRHRRKR